MTMPNGPGERDDIVGDEEQLLDIAEHFNQVDLDGDRRIDFKEFSQLMEDLEAGMSKEELRVGFSDIDTDHDGAIDFHEFLAWWSEE